MNEKRRKEVLKRGRPAVAWPGEPLLGSCYGEEEIEAVVRAIRDSMDPTVGFGFICEEIEEFERAFAEYCGTTNCVSINGAGGGLDMAVMCLDLEPGDEVICPSINFRAAPMSIIGAGAKLILCEIDPRTFNVDPNDVERRITPRTRAILPTHMNGLSAPMDDLLELAERHPHPKHGPIKVIGDGARACGGGYKGTKIGKRGWMNIFSFHTQKLMTTLGEGGAITTDDDGIIPRLKGIRQFGGALDDGSANPRGAGWGSNYKMTKVQAAVGLVQLPRLDGLIARRREVARARSEMLHGCPGLTLPYEPDGYEHTYYLYTILVPREWAGGKRDRLLTMLADEYGVNCVVANPPVHRTVAFIKRHTQGQELPLSDEIGARLFCPPMHPCMSEEDNEFICAAIWEAAARIEKGP
ncbi:MAG: DegT/DnrJ/EryC1/StrS family aminotransferase [Armatimonadota bacterium]|nr:MAG: DegT/DnrJ/EryC1/StrS family aminotransferase [Armatimonadota bacterium]